MTDQIVPVEQIVPETQDASPDPIENIWDIAPTAIKTLELRAIYQEVVSRLRADAQVRGGMAIDDLMMERVSFLYIWIRDKEMSDDLANWREYRDLHKLWLEMVQTYTKAIGSVDASEMRDIILKRVLAAINSVLRDMSPDLEVELRNRFTEAFSNLDI